MKTKNIPPFETRYHDLSGAVSIDISEGEDFNSFASGIAGFDPEKFEAVALRVYIGHAPIVTLFARDKSKEHADGKKIPVKVFKLDMSLDVLFARLRNFNFTVTSGKYKVQDMELTES
jgi:hypothetical protein